MRSMLHRITDALERDMEGGWKGVVFYDKDSRQFFRYTDDFGEHKERVL